MELKAKDIEQLIEQRPTLVVATAKWCPHCSELKNKIDSIVQLADFNGINLSLISIEEEENKEFFQKYPFETLPYCLVFVNKQFQGGDETHADMLEQIIPMISNAIQRDAS